MTVSYSASDSLTGVQSSDIKVEDANGDVVASDNSSSVSVSGLSDGDYRVFYNVVDGVGNWNNGSWRFTVDTSYDGGTSPSVDPGPQVFRSGGEPVRINVNVSEGSEKSDMRVRCLNDGSEIYTTDFKDVNGFEVFHCDIDSSDYRDISVDLTTSIEDRAGNSWEENVGKYTFDFSPPEFGNLSTPVNVFSEDFQVGYDSHDSASSVEKIHYQIDDSSYSAGAGDNLSAGNTFLVNVSGIDAGDHTVYAWAIDEAGWISERRSIDFEYMPSATPKVQLEAPETVEVEAGGFTTVELNVSDTGKLLVKDLELEADAGFWNASQTIDRLTPGETRSIRFAVNTEPSDMGSHRLLFSSRSPPATARTELVVRANDTQKQRIESSYTSFSQRFEGLESNVSRLMEKVSDNRADRLKSNFSKLNSTMEKAASARDAGEFYRVSALLDTASDQYSVASQSYETVREEHRVSVRNRNILVLLFLLVAGGGGTFAYLQYGENDFEFDMERLSEIDVPDEVDLDLGPLRERVERILKKLREEEEEVEEYSFNGFN